MIFIVYILALIILLKGVTQLFYLQLKWSCIKTAKRMFNRKVIGIVVEANELKVDDDGVHITDAVVEFTREGEMEACCRKFDSTLGMRKIRKTLLLDKGDLVDVWYNSRNCHVVFMMYHESFFRLFLQYLVGGMAYITAGILGIEYVYNA